MTGRKSVTIQDVAKRAEVSTSTVSHVLNNTRHVEAEKRERILAAIDALGYRPNMLARGLRGAGSRTIGLIISDIREDFFSELTKTIESGANDRGYMVMLCDSEESSDKEQRYLELLAARGADGIILCAVDGSGPPPLPPGWKLPVVLVDRRCAGADLDFVGIDNEASAAAAVAHFASIGRRQLGFIGHERSISTMAERVAGFTRGTVEHFGAKSRKTLTIESRGGDSVARIRRWITAGPDLDGILCGNANICFEALEALDDLGLDVPGRVGVATFDDLECFRFMRSPITAIAQPLRAMGLAALDAVIARCEGAVTGPGIETVLPTRLVVRESCGAARAGR